MIGCLYGQEEDVEKFRIKELMIIIMVIRGHEAESGPEDNAEYEIEVYTVNEEKRNDNNEQGKEQDNDGRAKLKRKIKNKQINAIMIRRKS